MGLTVVRLGGFSCLAGEGEPGEGEDSHAELAAGNQTPGRLLLPLPSPYLSVSASVLFSLRLLCSPAMHSQSSHEMEGFRAQGFLLEPRCHSPP